MSAVRNPGTIGAELLPFERRFITIISKYLWKPWVAAEILVWGEFGFHAVRSWGARGAFMKLIRICQSKIERGRKKEAKGLAWDEVVVPIIFVPQRVVKVIVIQSSAQSCLPN